MTVIVSSPAIVPMTSGRRASSIARASAFAWPGGVRMTSRFADESSETAQRRSADVSSLSRSRSADARQRVDEAAGRVANLDEAELGDVARDRRLDGIVADLAQRLGELLLRRERLLLHEAQDGALTVELAHREYLLENREPVRELVVGDGQRRAEAQDALARGTDQDAPLDARGDHVARDAVDLEAEQQAGATDLDGAGEPLERACERSALAPNFRRAAPRPPCRRPRMRRRTRPGCRRTCSRGRPARTRPAARRATSSAPIGRPLASPFASVTASGFVPRRCHAKKLPVRPTPVCTSSNTSKAPCSSAMSRARARNSGRAGWMPPSPCTGSMRMHAVSSSTAAASDAESFSLAKRTPGTSGSNAARFAGWPVTESAPSVRPWNEFSSATMPVLAGRLARVLDRRLDRLGAGVAEERAARRRSARRAARRARSIGSVQ